MGTPVAYELVKWKIISRLRNELRLKDRDEHHLYYDAADRLHLRCCGSQNSTESQRARLRAFGRKNAQSLLQINWLLFSSDYLDGAFCYNPMHVCASKHAQKSL